MDKSFQLKVLFRIAIMKLMYWGTKDTKRAHLRQVDEWKVDSSVLEWTQKRAEKVVYESRNRVKDK